MTSEDKNDNLNSVLTAALPPPLCGPSTPSPKTNKRHSKKRTSYDAGCQLNVGTTSPHLKSVDGNERKSGSTSPFAFLLAAEAPLLNLEGGGDGGGGRRRSGSKRQKSNTLTSRLNTRTAGDGDSNTSPKSVRVISGSGHSSSLSADSHATSSPSSSPLLLPAPPNPSSSSPPSKKPSSSSDVYVPNSSPLHFELTPPIGWMQDFVEPEGLFPPLPAAAGKGRRKGALPLLASFPDESNLRNSREFLCQWNIEDGNPGEEEGKATLIDSERYTPYYQHYFLNKEHEVYVGTNSAEEHFIVSVECPKLPREEDLEVHRRVLVISSKVNSQNNPPTMWGMLPSSGKKSILKQLFASPDLGNFLGDAKLIKVENERIFEEISKSETNMTQSSYKFGVLLCLDGQTTEEEMLQNNEEPPEFKEFLDYLGTTVDLAGFNGFTGGLDTKHGNTGNQTVTHTYQSIQIMYHVSTKLPYDEQDEQQIARKKHIGNDVVVFVYMMGDEPFNPSTFVSEFNHVFIAVKKCDTGYHINCITRGGIESTSPPLPDPPILTSTAKFREFLIVKAINGEREAMYAPKFSKKLDFVRKSVISDIVSTYSTPAKKQSKKSYVKNFDIKGKVSSPLPTSLPSPLPASAHFRPPPSSPRGKILSEEEREEEREREKERDGGEVKVAKAEIEELEGFVDGLLRELDREPLGDQGRAGFRVMAMEKTK